MKQGQLLRQIALAQTPLIGPVTARTLVAHAGSAEAVFEATDAELLEIPGIGPRIVENIRSGDGLRIAEEELKMLEKHGAEAIFFTDDRFPERFRDREDAPILMFFKGSDAEILNHPRIVGVVGTRKPSAYGRQMCEEILDGLRAHNCLIISGLAYGIDVTAHKFCCQKNIPTIGVMGSGMGRIYPDAHRSVAEKMIENGGLLTEYRCHVGPDREHFPQRNRIIAGLSDALLVVETAIAGGSMITAERAHDYSRNIFAVPARAKDAVGEGCNFLIKRQKASLCEQADDIAREMGWASKKSGGKQVSMPINLTEIEADLLKKVQKKPEIAIDDLIFELQKPSGEVAAALLNLEFNGMIKTLPGKRYVVV